MLHSSIWSCSFFCAHRRILWSSCHSPAAAELIVSKRTKKTSQPQEKEGRKHHTWAFLNRNVMTSNNGCESSQTLAFVLWNQRADQSMDLIILHPAACNNDSGELSRLALQSWGCSLSSVTQKTEKQRRLSQLLLRISALRELFLPPLKECRVVGEQPSLCGANTQLQKYHSSPLAAIWWEAASLPIGCTTRWVCKDVEQGEGELGCKVKITGTKKTKKQTQGRKIKPWCSYRKAEQCMKTQNKSPVEWKHVRKDVRRRNK